MKAARTSTVRKDIIATARAHGWDIGDIAYIFATIEMAGGDSPGTLNNPITG